MTAPFVLITTLRLFRRGGIQAVTRDFAKGLSRRGWRVAVYAPTLGAEADEIRPYAQVVSSLDEIEGTPDIIHGQQHPTIFTALVRFPDTPAIQFCHNADSWDDRTILLERIRRHVAVDNRCLDRIAAESGPSPEAVEFLTNAVDLDRCVLRGPLPASPVKALAVAHHGDAHLKTLVEACRNTGIELELTGSYVGKETNVLEREMARADVVFGAARIALEALAVGCAVVVCDAGLIAGMAREENFESWRRDNFGRRLVARPATEETIAEALAAYDARDATMLSARVREQCNLDRAIDRLEAIYREVIREQREGPPVDRAREAREFANYLTQWLPNEFQKGPYGEASHRMLLEVTHLRKTLDSVTSQLASRGLRLKFENEPPRS